MEFNTRKIQRYSLPGGIAMILLLALCYIVSFTNGEETKIIGGSPANPGEFPWMVSIMVRNSDGALNHLCGGTLIDLNFVITAAHCVIWYANEDLVILAGANRLREFEASQQLRQVDLKKVHENYNYTARTNDIARLRVSAPFAENYPFVSSIPFPAANHSASGSCTVAGWGTTTENSELVSNVLNKASLPIVPKNDCYQIYGEEFENNTQICAGLEQGGVDVCVGDTGGALICHDLGQRYFAGIASWGYLCARPRYPGVYTEISKYIQWIIT